MRARELAVGSVPCLALRVTYVGELGWELYCPTRVRPRALGRDLGRRAASTASSPAATRRSTRCGSRRATASGAPTSRPTTRRSRPGSGSRSSSTRASSSAARRCSSGRSPSGGSAAWCSTTRARSRSAPSRCASAASRRPRHERRLRLHGRALDRLRVPARRPSRSRGAGRGRDLRRVGRGRGRRGAALRSRGRADPRLGRRMQRSRSSRGSGRAASTRSSRSAAGITNHNFKIGAGGETFVLRIGGKDTQLLGIDREVEHAASLAAAALGIGPEVVAFLEPEGYLVTRFVEGEVGTRGRRRGGAGAAAAARRPAIPGRFDAFRVVETYARDRRGARRRHPAAVRLRPSEIARRIEERRRGAPSSVPATTTCSPRTSSATASRLWIVDWEYAGMGDPVFDLAQLRRQQRARRRRRAAAARGLRGGDAERCTS